MNATLQPITNSRSRRIASSLPIGALARAQLVGHHLRMPFAVVNRVRFEDPDRAATSTREVVIPRLRTLPGFVQAIFLQDGGRASGFSVMVFETSQQAEEMATRLGNGEVSPPPGIIFESQEVFEVVASG